jgi:hypothetical protein
MVLTEIWSGQDQLAVEDGAIHILDHQYSVVIRRQPWIVYDCEVSTPQRLDAGFTVPLGIAYKLDYRQSSS